MTEAAPTCNVDVAPAYAQTGRQLAAARESCGFSVAEIARQLKLSPSQVEALEAEDYARLPGAVFVRGFIRNYARLVKLDPALLLPDVERHLPSPTRSAPEAPLSVEIPFPSGRRFNWHKYAIAGLALLVPVVMFEFYSGDAPEVNITSSQVAPPQTQVVAAEPAAEAIVGEPPVAAISDAAGRAGKSPAEKPASSTRLADRPSRPGDHRVRLKFDRESWVEIRDRSGQRIFSQLNPAGSEQVVSGQPPLTLVVGNAVAVHLTHNDQRVDLAPYTKVDVARLTLE